MDIDRLNSIKREALKLKAAGKTKEFKQVAQIAIDYENGEELGTISAALIGVADGISARWGDELGGVVTGLYKAATTGKWNNFEKGYESGRDTLRGYQKEAEMTSPWAKGIGEVVGAVGSAGVGPSWLRAGEKGVEAVKLMKAAKGTSSLLEAARSAPYLKAAGQAIHTLGVPAAKYGLISGAGGAEGLKNIPVGMAVGGATGYAVGGTLGTLLGNLFYKPALEGGQGAPLTPAEVLARARETFEPEFLDKHQDEILHIHDLIKKHGFKGKGIGQALEEAEKKGKTLDEKLTSFMSNISNYYKFHESKGYVPKMDPTEVSARDLLDGFEGSLKNIGKEAYDHASEKAKIEKILIGFKDNLDDNSVRTLSEPETHWRRTGIEPDKTYGIGINEKTSPTSTKVVYGERNYDPISEGFRPSEPGSSKTIYEPGQTPHIEDILDRKIFNIKGQRQLLKYVNKLIEEGDRSKHDPEVATKFAGFMRNLYQKNLEKVDKAGMMQYGSESGVTPETPKEMHELIQLKDAFKSGASKTLNEEASRIREGQLPRWKRATRFAGDAFKASVEGPIGKARTVINAADRMLIKDVKPKGLMEVTPGDIGDTSGLPQNIADDMLSRYKLQDIKDTKVREYPKLLEPVKDLLSPRIRVKKPNINFQLQRDKEEENKTQYQHEEDIKDLENTQFRKTAPSMDEMMNWKQSSLNNPRTDKILTALKKARNNGEIISPTDPDFKKKIRKYLVDREFDLA
ncbi:MAG: hypothetical protein ACHQ1D_01705 [Nitrososphaerales archaeon]